MTHCHPEKVADVYVIPPHVQDSFVTWFQTFEKMGFKNEGKISIPPFYSGTNTSTKVCGDRIQTEIIPTPASLVPLAHSSLPAHTVHATASHGSSDVASFSTWDPAIDELVCARTEGSLWWPSKVIFSCIM